MISANKGSLPLRDMTQLGRTRLDSGFLSSIEFYLFHCRWRRQKSKESKDELGKAPQHCRCGEKERFEEEVDVKKKKKLRKRIKGKDFNRV